MQVALVGAPLAVELLLAVELKLAVEPTLELDA